MTYTNPILSGFHPDPSVCRRGDDYYLVTSSFEYFPGMPLFHSRDLVNWEPLGHVLTRASQLDLTKAGASGGVFAPTLRYHDGTFFLITTNIGGRGNFVVSAPEPTGPWSDPVWIDAGGIDPSLLFDGGKAYYTGTADWGGDPGIYGFEVDLKTGAQATPRRLIWPGTGGAHPEGPHLFRRGEWYYLVIAEGGTEHGHMVTVARSRQPLGPFESCPTNPVLTNRSLNTPVKSVGHSDWIEAPDGRWWAVCLATRPVGYPQRHHLGRETFLVPVVWNADGWPTVGKGGTVGLEMEAEGLAPQQPVSYPRDEFDGPTLGHEWNFLRNPDPADWSLNERPGWLTLHGSALSLDTDASPAWVGRRQEHLAVSVRSALDFAPERDGEEAGLSVLMNFSHHYEVAVGRSEGQRVLLVRRRIGTLVKVETQIACPSGLVVLGIDAAEAEYTFIAEVAGQTLTLGRGETRYLSTEVAGGFTGVYFGLYATGNGVRASTRAAFDWFDYRPV